ncbi:MAG: sigma-70 family RNA polymerase sigma factor [Vicinamibacterales bacterium]
MRLHTVGVDVTEVVLPEPTTEADGRAHLDEAAFTALYGRLSRPLVAYVRRLVADPSVADDLVQDTFCRLLRQRLPPMSDDELRRYVFRIASNVARDHWRSGTRNAAAAVAAESATSVPAPDHGRRADVEKSLNALRPQDRAMLWLAYVEGAPHREIADALGFKERSVKVLLFRARRKLSDVLVRNGLRQGRTS